MSSRADGITKEEQVPRGVDYQVHEKGACEHIPDTYLKKLSSASTLHVGVTHADANTTWTADSRDLAISRSRDLRSVRSGRLKLFLLAISRDVIKPLTQARAGGTLLSITAVLATMHFYRMQMQEEEPEEMVTEPEEMEQIYKETLYSYKLRLDNIMKEKARATSDLQIYESKVQMMHDESARAFDELLQREREVAIGLIYAKTGRKLTEKVAKELTHRQVGTLTIAIMRSTD